MQIQRRYAAVIAGIGFMASVSGLRGNAAPPRTSKVENSLLGVHLMSTYKDVLRRFGQPAEIQVGMPLAGEGDSGGASSGAVGGGFPGSGGPVGGSQGSSGVLPPPPNAVGKGGGGLGPSLPGFGGSGGFPGIGGAPGSSGSPGSGGAPGSAGGAGGSVGGTGTGGLPIIPGSGGESSGPSEETVWWYKFPQQGRFYAFLFNKQGRVIQIQAHGFRPHPNTPVAKNMPAPVTAQGITLGMQLGAVLKNYGWSNDGEHVGDYVVLRYGAGQDRIAFQSLHNEIIGITVGIVK